jgi:hypothetical protein
MAVPARCAGDGAGQEAGAAEQQGDLQDADGIGRGILTADISFYRFFQPPRCPGAPPLERGVGPNSGPDWRESLGWKILLPVAAGASSGEGFREDVRPGR